MEGSPRVKWSCRQHRGPIPKDVSLMKENSPYAPGRVPALFIPARHEAGAAAKAGVREHRTGAHTDRPQEHGEELAQNIIKGFNTARSSLPDMESEGRHARQFTLSHDGSIRFPGPDFDTFERSKRCAIHIPRTEPPITSAPKDDSDEEEEQQRRSAAAAQMKSRVVETKGLGHAKSTYRMSQSSQRQESVGDAMKKQISLQGSRTLHLNITANEDAQRPNIGRLQDSVNLLLQRTNNRQQRVLRDGRYANYWDALQKDDEYLMKTTMTQDFKGRRALNQPPGELARYKASQIQYLWRRSALQKEAKAAREEEEERMRAQRTERVTARRKREEEQGVLHKEENKRNLLRLGNIVFKALCTDPRTGQPTDPKAVFRRLDEDKSGSVDVVEFQRGLEMCNCFLSDHEIHTIWDEIDEADGGERDGQVDYAVLVARLQAVNETALRGLRAPEIEQLRRQSADALEMVRKKVQKEERARRAQAGGFQVALSR